uniref:Uncharacterized protein n=1 Tax=Arundo donax TaxID=35708 RepID=A0A0A9BR69_ARUDO
MSLSTTSSFAESPFCDTAVFPSILTAFFPTSTPFSIINYLSTPEAGFSSKLA